ncbi:MAG: type II secretion system secretin GspD [Chromatiales bacterium]|jgi:general secretion pathway protein D|nr:type II secretion system secretin GspD [Chromatiales bacterium]
MPEMVARMSVVPNGLDRFRRAKRLPTAALLLALCMPSFAGAANGSGGPVTLNLHDADISAVITTVSEVTGRNFIVDPRVKGRITIVSSRPMSQNEVYQVFLSVLDVHGFAAVDAGSVTKIIPDANAKQLAVPVTDERQPGKGDEVVTRVIELRNISAAQLVPILRPLVPQQGHMAAYVPSNMLILSDRASNIERIANIINRIDVRSEDEIEVVSLQHASASEIVRIITALDQQRRTARGAGGGGETGEDTSVLIADERTNSVLIGGGKSGRLRLRTIIAHLDTPVRSEGNTQVYYLSYARAADLVPVLTGVSTSVEQQAQIASGAAAAGQGAAPSHSGRNIPVNIQADENTNSVVVTAPPDILRALEGVIKQLDVRRAQVHVEGVIAEISSSADTQFGVEWIADGQSGGHNAPVGLTNFQTGTGSSIAEVATSLISGTSLPSIGNGLTLGVGRWNSGGINIAALIRALKSNGSTNILSTPSLVTLDNQEAEITVGEQVPFVTGSYATTGGTSTVANPFQTIQRQNVGITLKVRPQINEGNAVKLDIEQQIDSLSPSTRAVDLITNTRSIKTSIIVDDGETVVLGGLIRDDVQQTVQKVPLLGDIPLLGWLFRSQTASKVKTNLMVFLKPTIIRDTSLARTLSTGKYDYMRTLQLDMRDKGLLMMPREEAPVMPTFDEMLAVPPTLVEDDNTGK